MSYDQTFEIIEKNAGSHFDPVIAKIFVENREKMIEVNESYLEEQKRHLNDDSDNDIEILEILEEV